MIKPKHIFVSLVLVVLSSYIGYNYMYKQHRDISKETASYVYEIEDLIKEFSFDNKGATDKFLDKTIQLNGLVTEKDSDNFTLNDAVLCYSDSITLLKISLQKEHIVKGRFIGYDELLEQIKLDQTTIINK